MNNLRKLQEFEKARILADPPSWPYQPELAVFPDPAEIMRPEDLTAVSSMNANYELAKSYYTHHKKIMLEHLGSLPWNKRSSVAQKLYTTMLDRTPVCPVSIAAIIKDIKESRVAYREILKVMDKPEDLEVLMYSESLLSLLGADVSATLQEDWRILPPLVPDFPCSPDMTSLESFSKIRTGRDQWFVPESDSNRIADTSQTGLCAEPQYLKVTMHADEAPKEEFSLFWKCVFRKVLGSDTDIELVEYEQTNVRDEGLKLASRHVDADASERYSGFTFFHRPTKPEDRIMSFYFKTARPYDLFSAYQAIGAALMTKPMKPRVSEDTSKQ